MINKKEKLTEALKEYFGKDIGDISQTVVEPEFLNRFPHKDLVSRSKRITIITKPHKPTLKEKHKELVDQLEKDLKEIDDNFSVAEGMGTPDVTYIRCSNFPYCELYLNGDVDFHGAYGNAKKMAKAMEAISGFSWELRQLKEQYKDEAI